MREENYIRYAKRFVKGEQDLVLCNNGKIENVGKDYYWSSDIVCNHILTILELKYGDLLWNKKNERKIFGKTGLASRLIPLQKEFNVARRHRIEHANKLTNMPIAVEDGSVDLDQLSEEGLGPGSILVYRQGSAAPIQYQPIVNIEFLDVLEDRLLQDMYTIAGVKEDVRIGGLR